MMLEGHGPVNFYLLQERYKHIHPPLTYIQYQAQHRTSMVFGHSNASPYF